MAHPTDLCHEVEVSHVKAQVFVWSLALNIQAFNVQVMADMSVSAFYLPTSDLHSAALKQRIEKANLSKTQAYVEEGRMAALELMGHLVSYYRTFYMGARKLRGFNPIQPNQPTQEDRHE